MADARTTPPLASPERSTEAPTGGNPPTSARRARKPPRKVSPSSLENAALFYLGRFSAPSGHLRRVLLRRVERSLKVHGGDAATARGWVDDLIERFRRSGLVDDAAYAAGKARSLRRRGTSQAMIGRALRAKGLSAEQAAAALNGMTTDTGQDSTESELAAAARLTQRKRLGPYRPAAARAEQRQRDMASLARAGFAYDTARRVIDAEDIAVIEAWARGVG